MLLLGLSFNESLSDEQCQYLNSGDCLMPPPLPNQPTAHPLTHLTNNTQNLTGLVHAQMEDIKVQTELMRKQEERDKAPASMLVRQGFATVFAVSVLSNAKTVVGNAQTHASRVKTTAER
ncbi:hypothetical protein BC835DRAFT_1308004 [Cytidiella melzeri]|nr:hypothetical protein BC835DRAFT_1308004 [Cytidiella melzeri]